MKLEIRKETKPDGDVFYHVYMDDRFLKGFFAGNSITKGFGGYGEEKALQMATAFYEQVKSNAQDQPIVEIIKSETI